MLLLALLTTALLAGSWLLRSRGLDAGLEGAVYRLLLGLLVVVTLLLPLVPYSLNVAGGILIVVAVVGMTREVFRRRPESPRPIRIASAPLNALETACAVALFAMGLGMLIRALAPPVHPEALAIHFALAKDAILEGRIVPMERHPLSDGVDLGRATRALLYLWQSAITLSAWQALTALTATAALYALVLRVATRQAALLSATAFAAMPAWLNGALTGGNDLLAAAYLFAALAAFERWRQEGQSICGVLAGVLMGGACATGAIGWLALPAWLVLLLMGGPRGPVRSVILGLTPLLTIAAVWWAVASSVPGESRGLDAMRVWLSLSGSPSLDFLATRLDSASMVPQGRWPFFAWDAYMRPAWFEGPWFSPGPLAIALGPPAMLWCGRDARRLGLFAIAMGIAVMIAVPSTRLLLPTSAMMIAVAAVAVERSPRLRRLGLAAFAVAIAGGLALHGLTAADRMRVVAGLESRDAFRARHIPASPALAWCNTHFEEGALLSFDPHAFLLESPAFVNYTALFSLQGEPAWRQTQWLEERNLRYIVYPETALLADDRFRSSGLAAIVRRWQLNSNRFIQRAVFHDADGGVTYIYEMRDVDATF